MDKLTDRRIYRSMGSSSGIFVIFLSFIFGSFFLIYQYPENQQYHENQKKSEDHKYILSQESRKSDQILVNIMRKEGIPLVRRQQAVNSILSCYWADHGPCDAIINFWNSELNKDLNKNLEKSTPTISIKEAEDLIQEIEKSLYKLVKTGFRKKIL